jgi:maleylacetoacetate isomerase
MRMQATLYDYWRSSAAYRLRIAFNIAGVPFSSVPVDLLRGAQRSPDNLARNPQGLVPTVDIDGKRMTQSLAIIEYLHDTGVYPFLPADPETRARVRALSYVIAMEIHPVCNLSTAQFAVSNSGGKMDLATWMDHFIAKGLAAFEAMLDPADDCCVGDTLSMADICLVPQLYNAERWGVSLSDLPKIRAIGARLGDLPAFSNAHPDRFKPAGA